MKPRGLVSQCQQLSTISLHFFHLYPYFISWSPFWNFLLWNTVIRVTGSCKEMGRRPVPFSPASCMSRRWNWCQPRMHAHMCVWAPRQFHDLCRSMWHHCDQNAVLCHHHTHACATFYRCVVLYDTVKLFSRAAAPFSVPVSPCLRLPLLLFLLLTSALRIDPGRCTGFWPAFPWWLIMWSSFSWAHLPPTWPLVKCHLSIF